MNKLLNEIKISPVAIFAYNRLPHLEATINALAKNTLANRTKVFIFSDGYKNEKDEYKVKQVRNFLKKEKFPFLETTVFYREENKGLSNNIIEGVSSIINKYGRIIVIEDDVITSPDFLQFMNEALMYYETNEKVWSVGGYSHPMKMPSSYHEDIYAVQRCSSYCWGTWKNRWDIIDWEIRDYAKFKYNIFARYKFNRSGNDMSAMLDSQMTGRINSWAIRFDYNMWKNGKFNILPVQSKANNIGHDGSGTHAGIDLRGNDKFQCEIFEVPYILNDIEIQPEIIREYRKIFSCKLRNLFKSYCKNIILNTKR